MEVRLEALGCRLNLGEIHHLGRALRARGHRVVGPEDPADLIVLNTCTVTQGADRKSRKTIRRLRRAHPRARLVVTGCFTASLPGAPESKTELDAIEEVLALGADMVVDNTEKDRLVDHLVGAGFLEPEASSRPGPIPTGDRRLEAPRVFLKVQDGCDQACTFCVVTLARGAARSRGAREIVEEIRELEQEGVREVVLSGVHLGGYGRDLGGEASRPTLSGLVRRILEETDLPRLRLSSLEPWDLGADFFALLSEERERLLPHLHLPLQSGSDRILRRMARRSSRVRFSELVAAIREARPGIALSSDLIVGFPGETEGDFLQSLELCESLELSGLHVFPFSPRAGTAAASFDDPVPGHRLEARRQRALELADRLERRARTSSVGERRPVLWESFEELAGRRRHHGLTDHYQRVSTRTGPGVVLAGQILETELIGVGADELLGAITSGRASAASICMRKAARAS